MYQAMHNFRHQKGFTLIEILIVVTIIGILAVIAIPGYLGMQERSRKGAVTRSASSAEPDLHGWLTAANKGLAGGRSSLLIEIDTNGNGVIASPDLNNSALGGLLTAGTLCSQYVFAKRTLQAETSPWVDTVGSLWVPGAAASGRITCSVNTANKSLSLRATDQKGNTIHQKDLYSD